MPNDHRLSRMLSRLEDETVVVTGEQYYAFAQGVAREL